MSAVPIGADGWAPNSTVDSFGLREGVCQGCGIRGLFKYAPNTPPPMSSVLGSAPALGRCVYGTGAAPC